MGLLDQIKSDVKKSGQNRGRIFYVTDGNKARVRFLQDMDSGIEFTWHSNYEKGIATPCREFITGNECPYCEDENIRTRSMYVWSVYDYESKEVKLFMFAVNNCSPIPALVAMYENYGTLTDRDYVISVAGKQTNKTYSVVPMDKNKFRNEKAKPLSKKAIIEILKKAYPDDSDSDNEDDEQPKNKKKQKANKVKKEVVEDDDEDNIVDDDEDSEVDNDYSGMSARELYDLCKRRNISVNPKMKDKYYIRQLEEWDKAQEDWDEDSEEEDDEEEWEDE